MARPSGRLLRSLLRMTAVIMPSSNKRHPEERRQARLEGRMVSMQASRFGEAF
jgi:hypothetical protein